MPRHLEERARLLVARTDELQKQHNLQQQQSWGAAFFPNRARASTGLGLIRAQLSSFSRTLFRI